MFDPLGLVAFLTVLPRIILREVWRAGSEWDEAIPQECGGPWEEWLQCLDALAEKRIPRWYGSLGDAVHLHIFVDASDKAMAAVVYACPLQSKRKAAFIQARIKAAPSSQSPFRDWS